MSKKEIPKKKGAEYDPAHKQEWHLELEQAPVNDSRWSCSVVAAVESEASDSACITMYTQAVATRMRMFLYVIALSDVTKLFKDKPASSKVDKPQGLQPPPPRPRQILDFAAQFATSADGEITLPPDLMAAVVKHVILDLKTQDCFQRRVKNAMAKKKTWNEIKKKFIEANKLGGPKNPAQKLKETPRGKGNVLGIMEPIEDAPYGGPDVYILLTGFYNPLYFAELVRLNVPFVAVVRVQCLGTLPNSKQPASEKGGKGKLILRFWEDLMTATLNQESAMTYKDIGIVKYKPPIVDSSQDAYKAVFNDLACVQFRLFSFYRQFQRYVRQLSVQPVVEALSPLSLTACELYTSLCDALTTSEMDSAFLVLYAMIEQVVHGVEDIETVRLEYESQVVDLDDKEVVGEEVAGEWGDDLQCKDKQPLLLVSTSQNSNVGGQPEPDCCEEALAATSCSHIISIIFDVLKEFETSKIKRRIEPSTKVLRRGDNLALRSLDVSEKLFDACEVQHRFFTRSNASALWSQQEPLSAPERAYYSYQLQRLWETDKEDLALFRQKVHFAVAMHMMACILPFFYKGDVSFPSYVWSMSGSFLPKVCRMSEPSSKPSDDFWDTYSMNVKHLGCRLMKDVFNVSSPALSSDVNERRPSWSRFSPLETPKSTEYPCSRAPDIFHFKPSPSEEMFQEQLDQLRKMFSCPDILVLNEPKFVSSVELYESLVSQYKTYEQLEPVRMVQVLQEALQVYTTMQGLHFKPTDCLVLLCYNEQDHRGLSHSSSYAHLSTPVALRDFIAFVYPEVTEWAKNEEETYVKFQLEHQQKKLEATKRMEKDIWQRILTEFNSIDETARKVFVGGQDVQPTPEKGKEKKNGNKKKPLEREDIEVKEEDLEELPRKIRFCPCDETVFPATNLPPQRCQVCNTFHQFNSQDGSTVSVTKSNWLFTSDQQLTVKIQKRNCHLYYHHTVSSPVMKAFHVVTESGLLMVFSEAEGPQVFKEEHQLEESNKKNKTSKQATVDVTPVVFKPQSSFKFLMRITWPTGLVVEAVPGRNEERLYIKQSYKTKFAPGGNKDLETCRCFLGNGNVLIFRQNGNVNILTTNSTKYDCFEFLNPEPQVPEKLEMKEKEAKEEKKEKGKKTTVKATEKVKPISEDDKPGSSSLIIVDYDVTKPNGELWAQVCQPRLPNKEKLVEKHRVYQASDLSTGEVYYRRADGSCCMLWPDGKLVVTYPDGTKITSTPEFIEDVTSSNESIAAENFTSISCSVLMEHPRYASVYYSATSQDVEVQMPQTKVIVHMDGTYNISLKENIELDITESETKFVARCELCKGTTTSSLTFGECLCTTTDHFNNTFSVLAGGSVIYDEYEEEFEGEVSESEKCDHSQPMESKQRCFVLERDLSGVEILPQESVEPCSTQCQRVYDTHETWVMSYRHVHDALPTNLTRQDLKCDEDVPVLPPYRQPFPKFLSTFVPSQTPTHFKPPRMPKAIVVSHVRLLHPSPLEVLRDVHNKVRMYQETAENQYLKYSQHVEPDNRSRDQRYTEMKLRKIALAMASSLRPFTHTAIQTPSTERDVHYTAHSLDLCDMFKPGSVAGDLPDCKQLRSPLPHSGREPIIYETTNNCK